MRGFVLVAGVALAVVCRVLPAAGIDIDEANSRFWQFDGERLVLIGGSVDDNLFQIDDLEAHLDELAAVGGNYVRNTMSSRDRDNLWPFKQGFARDGRAITALSRTAKFRDRLAAWSDNRNAVYPKYDLEQFNDEYWRRFEALLRLARERDIVVQVEIWDRFDYARDPWLRNPFNPDNNVNYTENLSGMLAAYPEHPGKNRNAFFRSVPSLLHNGLLLAYQNALLDKLLSISLRYDNVLYTISNETNGDEPWSTYWAWYIRSKADAVGKKVFITEMWNPHDLDDPMHARTFDHPERYDFVEVSQNNHQVGQAHWDNLVRVRQRLADVPRPMNNVKVYGADGGRFESTNEAIDRFWRSLLGGSATVRFHRPEQNFGLGLGDEAKRQLLSANALLEALDLTALAPQSDVLRQREDNEAYLTAAIDRQYVVYFPNGGDVVLPVNQPGKFALRWLRVDATEWRDAASDASATELKLETPSSDERWIAVLTRPD
ncbi:MAG: hypothetical protein AAFM91_00850 [Pseudomonadota bacterium]